MAGQRHLGRRALVTGAASGIGYATAVRLALDGAIVTACDVNAAGLEALVDEVAGQATITTVRADVTDPDDVARAVAVAAGGRHVDLLANVAGVMDHWVPLHAITDDFWARVLDVNLTAPMRLCRAVVPGMVANGWGAIVNVASRAGQLGSGAGVAYVASKHALVGLTRSVAVRYARDGIRCNAVAPGGVLTGLGVTATPTDPHEMALFAPSMSAAIRMAEPSEVAAVISWLLSDEASTVNGAILPADSGWTAG